ncbi:MAG: hypothetical protein JW797_10285 [Bradymonadales bacterium]|nr:hypothetical protein [Bradymonadales bacterium]
MSWIYRCPHCNARLNPHDTIILVGARGGQRILAGFHPEPGNYEIFFPPEVELTEGERWDFSCPVCGADLVSDQNENLCVLHAIQDDQESQVVFSRIAGEQATYVVREGAISERHGKHWQTYFEYLMSVRFI